MRVLNPILGIACTMACLATAQVNLVVSLVMFVTGMFFLLRG